MPYKTQRTVTIRQEIYEKAGHRAKACKKSIAGYVTGLIEKDWRESIEA